MSIGVEALFTSALGLAPPWEVQDVQRDTARKRIDFEVRCSSGLLTCPACGAATQKAHDRLRRSWRHLDFFQFEAWLHADVPRVGYSGCGKTTQLEVPWARPGSGFTAAFEALALALCRELPVRQAAKLCAAPTSLCGGKSSSTLLKPARSNPLQASRSLSVETRLPHETA